MRPKGDEVRVTDAEGEAAEKLLHYSSFGTASAEHKIRHNAESIRKNVGKSTYKRENTNMFNPECVKC